MIALDVPYADELNRATDKYNISQALMQGIIDDAAGLPVIPARAQQFATEYARSNDVLETSAEATIMAMAWWLSYMFGRLGNQWQVVEIFYGSGPMGRIAMTHLASGSYEARRRQWS